MSVSHAAEEEILAGPEPGIETAATPEEGVPRWGKITTPLIVTIGLLVTITLAWWAFGDPKWGLIGGNQAKLNAVLFWTILATLWTGFCFGRWPFNKLPQPLSGIVQCVVDVAIAVAMVAVFTRVVGSWDPTFGSSAGGGSGYSAAAFIVLIAFIAYGVTAANVDGYPYEGQEQPQSGVGQWLFGTVLTLVGVVWLIYPNFSPALAKTAPLKLPFVTGWIYSGVVVLIFAAMLWENLPWARVPNRHLRYLTAMLVVLGGGFIVYLATRGIASILVPAHIKATPGFSLDSEAANVGVCLNLWALIIGLVWPARSENASPLASRLTRTVVTLVLGVGSYVLFMRWAATTIFHFPAVSGHYGGAPLTLMDVGVLLVLWYAGSFGLYGALKAAPEH